MTKLNERAITISEQFAAKRDEPGSKKTIERQCVVMLDACIKSGVTLDFIRRHVATLTAAERKNKTK